MRRLSELGERELSGVPVILRADLNVPVKDGVVADAFRIRRSLRSVLYLREQGAKTILVAHHGRDPKETLKPIAEALRTYVPLSFIDDIVGNEAKTAVSAMRAGDVLLLENVRRNEGEKANDATFGSALASFGSLYVNDAFCASHRSHASIVGVPKHLPAYAGFLFADEVEHLSAALSPQKPSLAILGGAKFDTKEPLIKKLLSAYDTLFLAGALVNDVLKAKGLEVGRSLVSEKGPDPSVLAHPHLLLPVDVLVERPDGQARVRKVHEVQKDEKIVDIGPVSFGMLLPYIQQAQFILWNGPTGLYEGGYDDWTSAIAEAVAETKAQSIVGGGDTVAAIGSKGLEEQFTFLSTAGGAMLEFLLNGTLPGIDALKESSIV